MAMLEVKDLQVFYDNIQALKGISLEINEGEVVSIIGANGAGKTTTLQTISGLITPKSGSITFEGKNLLLMIFLILVVQSSDVLQYVWGKLFGKRKIAPTLSPSKTVEGFVGGVLSASLLGMLLHWLTPFSAWQAFLMSLLICLMGFLGGLVMSAMKRSMGVKDWGNMISGHGGILDRMDSLCFSAPIFFHVVRYFWA